ncbi:hypothetical protein D4A92_24225 (plasmid) [Rhizobium rosettiformans]|uniref:Uncharacterized protein n=1 Tax=Rhizobium rosettiformans TaxID=1368430 RepID=A0ABX7F5M4_9HYPH|nr:hypothetical protein D4A92_24225 [Rhizobium rosettiformans]
MNGNEASVTRLHEEIIDRRLCLKSDPEGPRSAQIESRIETIARQYPGCNQSAKLLLESDTRSRGSASAANTV